MWHLINVDSDGIRMKKTMKMVMMVIITLVTIILMMTVGQKVFWKCLLLETELVLRHTQFVT